MDEILSRDFESIYSEVRHVIENARDSIYRNINFNMVLAYWNIGKIIVEEEQKGSNRAEYGTYLLKLLAERLTDEFGRGFTLTNLRYMRQFYFAFPIHHALRDELSWTHYRLLLKVGKEDARSFYLVETAKNKWSTRELERQMDSLLYERLALSKDPAEVKKLSTQGQLIKTSKDLIKDPYILEFLGIKQQQNFLEKDLEDLLISRLQEFLLELGAGFAFVDRQKRITVDGDHYYIDLVFYNYILKCFVLIDLKLGKLTHQDIGQIDFYVRYFEKEEKQPGDNPTIGLILCSNKNEAMVKYTLLNESKNLFASKYKLYLPSEEELKKELTRERELIEQEKRLANGE
ncbi:YhcG family protein [Methanosarcina sp. WH1]|uniref:PDDEXK nuclease domain-containing protein n=1 Tax=Methanosarcina sp. WH1 TaxID=1434102 RepID=UPI000615CE6E|nr:PDDEXK nuclease domain-containing protein [Methanosarcina sp. WH1]AKB21735.1 Putative cytoplasmic protein [Methanosarcina sp. WH1]